MDDIRKGTCPRCQHNRVLHVTQVADRIGEMGGAKIQPREAACEAGQFEAWRLVRMHRLDGGIFSEKVQAAGLVTAYVCRSCGYTEFYVRDPDLIPIDNKTVREIVGPSLAAKNP